MDNKFIYKELPPPDSLSLFVRFFWEMESKLPSYHHRSFADLNCEFIFHYKGESYYSEGPRSFKKLYTAGVQCQSNIYQDFYAHGEFGIFGVYLYPYTIPFLAKCHGVEITNKHLTIEDIWPAVGRDLENQILEANSTMKRYQIIARFLENELLKTSAPNIFRVIKEMLETNPKTIDIKKMAYDTNMSYSTFLRQIKMFTGFTPREIIQINRFSQIFNWGRNSDLSLTEISCLSDYYDQAHFIRDFKRFSGYNPREYFRKKVDSLIKDKKQI